MNGQKYEKITLIVYAQYDERHDKELFFDVYQDTEKTYCSQRIMPPFPGMAPIAGWRHNGRAGRRNREQITVEQKFISGFQRSRTPPEAGTGEGPGGKGICLDAKYLRGKSSTTYIDKRRFVRENDSITSLIQIGRAHV